MRDSQSNKNRLREVMFLDSEDDSLIGGDQGDETFDDSENDIKNRPLKESHKHRGRTRKKTNPRIFLISLAINAVLSALLFASWTYTASLKKVISLKEGRCNSDMYPADLRSYIDVEEPWSPAQDAIEYELVHFQPNMIFQSEPSDQVDQAWKDIQGPYDGVIRVSAEDALKLQHESVADLYNPKEYIYGISMFHQLHCLDRIRKSFYRTHYFPNETDADFLFHKAHCIDLLRQHLQCNGNVGFTSWWNSEYYTMKKMENDSIVRTYSDWYLSLNETGKAKNSFVTWDLVHKCRKFERIMAWAVDVVRIPKFEDTPNMMHVNGHKHVSEKGQVVKDGEPGGFNAELEDGN